LSLSRISAPLTYPNVIGAIGTGIMYSILKQRQIGAVSRKSKTIPVTGRGGSWGCETSKIPLSRHSAHKWQWGLTRRPPFTPRKSPGIHFR
jgi:hypothetical protein